MGEVLNRLRALAETRDREGNLKFARNEVPRMREYRDSKGVRIGLPKRPVEPSGVGFADLVTSGLEKVASPISRGELTGFGRFMCDEGREEEVFSRRTGERTNLPPENVSAQDLYDDRGTPGGGTELVDEDESSEVLQSEAHQIIARRTLSQWKSDLSVLEKRITEVMVTAQRLENEGQVDKAAVLDRQALKLGRKIMALRSKIETRQQYEQDVLVFEEEPSGMSFDEMLEL